MAEPQSAAEDGRRTGRLGLAMDSLKGAATALVSSLLVALLFAYTFRLPIPLGGMLGPFGTVNPYAMSVAEVGAAVFVAWLFYGVFGGFLLLPLCGAVAGYWASRRFAGEQRRSRMVMGYAALASAIPVTGLALLDYLIGPW